MTYKWLYIIFGFLPRLKLKNNPLGRILVLFLSYVNMLFFFLFLFLLHYFLGLAFFLLEHVLSQWSSCLRENQNRKRGEVENWFHLRRIFLKIFSKENLLKKSEETNFICWILLSLWKNCLNLRIERFENDIAYCCFTNSFLVPWVHNNAYPKRYQKFPSKHIHLKFLPTLICIHSLSSLNFHSRKSS